MLIETTVQAHIAKLLKDHKAEHVLTLDVRHLTDVTDCLIICSALSTPHMNALSNKVIETLKSENIPVSKPEGSRESGWMLIDLQGIVVHIMLSQIRDFYQLEKLWTMNQAAHSIEANL